jgi:hypothetical protein
MSMSSSYYKHIIWNSRGKQNDLMINKPEAEDGEGGRPLGMSNNFFGIV